MQFSEDDNNLVEIIDEVGKVALASGRKRKEGRIYVDIMVRAYINDYIEANNGTMPDRSLFGEAIDSYVSENFRNGKSSKIVKNMIRKMIFGVYDKCRVTYYRDTANCSV